MSSAIKVHNITVSYQSRTVLRGISTEIKPGTINAIIGPNGAGKSTLFKAILGLIPRDTGTVEIFGQTSQSLWHRKVAYIPQRENIDWDFPIVVQDLVMMGQYKKLGWFRFIKKANHEVVKKSLKEVGMEHFADRHIRMLSGGQQQRVFIARALAQESDILFMDEPFVGVDAKTQKAILNIIEKLKGEGKTIIMINHDLSILDRFDNILMLNKRLVAAGSPQEVYNDKNRHLTYGGQIAVWDEAETALRGV